MGQLLEASSKSGCRGETARACTEGVGGPVRAAQEETEPGDPVRAAWGDTLLGVPWPG